MSRNPSIAAQWVDAVAAVDRDGAEVELTVRGLVAYDPGAEEWRLPYIEILYTDADAGGDLRPGYRERDAVEAVLMAAARVAGVGRCAGDGCRALAGDVDWLCDDCRSRLGVHAVCGRERGEMLCGRPHGHAGICAWTLDARGLR